MKLDFRQYIFVFRLKWIIEPVFISKFEIFLYDLVVIFPQVCVTWGIICIFFYRERVRQNEQVIYSFIHSKREVGLKNHEWTVEHWSWQKIKLVSDLDSKNKFIIEILDRFKIRKKIYLLEGRKNYEQVMRKKLSLHALTSKFYLEEKCNKVNID